jgi:tetratricopeptide (TPR) repeat protein
MSIRTNLTLLLPLFLVSAALLPQKLSAQTSEFRMANHYMQQQKYEEALPILRELHAENPSSFTFFDNLADCLINLKKFDEAIKVAETKIQNEHSVTRTSIKLAEIYHVSGDTDRAVEIWQEVLEAHPNQMQVIHNVGESMNERREYMAAVELYKQAREDLNNTTLFSNELANSYMQAGMFREAVNEYYKVIKESPQQMSFIQQRFLRMRDENLYSTAALELEDFLLELDTGHYAYSQLFQLLSWLFLETEDYRRAFVSARQYESRTAQTNYALFSLGNRFRSARQYELAADAFAYYIENESSLRTRATEEKAITYLQWARYLEQHGLQSSNRQNELFEKAYRLSEQITENSPNYNRIERVLSNLIDLSLDHYKDPEKAEKWYRQLSEIAENDGNTRAYTLYAEGRLALFKGDYTLARQALTRADRASEDSNLSEKTRYYLTLSDFFSGDYEFAEIQLKSLERRRTSYFANNAIQLRMWIKNGMRMDTTNVALKQFSEGLRLMHLGKYDEAIESMKPILDTPTHPFADDLTVELTKHLPHTYQASILQLLEKQVAENQHSPLRERLMWERAIISERLYLAYDTSQEDSLFEEEMFGTAVLPPESLTSADIEDMFEDILLEFPDGFYARFAREKLQQSAQPQTL